MLASPEQRIRNTAQMMDAPGERAGGRRVRATPMTRALGLRAARRPSAAPTPATTTYYFYGTTQDNEHEFGPGTLGTVEGDGHDRDPRQGLGHRRAAQRTNDIIGTLVHETSHIIVADYGEHPGTDTDAGSFDRYKDEFRAYFIEPNGPFTALAPDDRADRDPQPHRRRERGRRRLRGPRPRVLGRAAGDQHVPRPGPRPPPPGRLQPRQQPVPGPARAPAARLAGGPRDGRGRRSSRSPSSPPPSAPKRRARR